MQALVGGDGVLVPLIRVGGDPSVWGSGNGGLFSFDTYQAGQVTDFVDAPGSPQGSRHMGTGVMRASGVNLPHGLAGNTCVRLGETDSHLAMRIALTNTGAEAIDNLRFWYVSVRNWRWLWCACTPWESS